MSFSRQSKWKLFPLEEVDIEQMLANTEIRDTQLRELLKHWN